MIGALRQLGGRATAEAVADAAGWNVDHTWVAAGRLRKSGRLVVHQVGEPEYGVHVQVEYELTDRQTAERAAAARREEVEARRAWSARHPTWRRLGPRQLINAAAHRLEERSRQVMTQAVRRPAGHASEQPADAVQTGAIDGLEAAGSGRPERERRNPAKSHGMMGASLPLAWGPASRGLKVPTGFPITRAEPDFRGKTPDLACARTQQNPNATAISEENPSNAPTTDTTSVHSLESQRQEGRTPPQGSLSPAREDRGSDRTAPDGPVRPARVVRGGVGGGHAALAGWRGGRRVQSAAPSGCPNDQDRPAAGAGSSGRTIDPRGPEGHGQLEGGSAAGGADVSCPESCPPGGPAPGLDAPDAGTFDALRNGLGGSERLDLRPGPAPTLTPVSDANPATPAVAFPERTAP